MLVVAAGLLFGACRATVGEFQSGGYAHASYPYLVRYVDPAHKSLMPPDWQLDNLYERRGGYSVKKGADYQFRLFLDVDHNGERDDLGEFPTFDLRFTHKKNSGVIWLRTIPLERDQREKEPRVLLDAIVEGISGGGYDVIQLEGKLYATNNQRRYAAKVVQSGEGSVAGMKAFVATVDVSNVDTLKVDPKSVEVRLNLVVAHTSFEFKTKSRRASGKAPGSGPGGPAPDYGKFPVLLLGGYANAPADFESGIPDFHGLLSRIEVDGKTGFVAPAKSPKARPTPEPSADAAPAPAPPPDTATPAPDAATPAPDAG